MPSYCPFFWFKTEILAYDFFNQSENSLCKLKAFHKWTYYAKNLLFWTTCFRHLCAFCWGFENIFTFGTSLEDVKISGDIISRMRSTRISKTSPFSASDLKLANTRSRLPCRLSFRFLWLCQNSEEVEWAKTLVGMPTFTIKETGKQRQLSGEI